MEFIENFGIITSISWNSNDWKKPSTDADRDASKYGYVQESDHTHEDLNFGHEVYPSEEDGYYIAYSPIFNRLPSAENSKNVSIVFLISTDYGDEKKRKIVGCYGHPEIGAFSREAKHKSFEKYDFGNIKSYPENIIYFKNPIEINKENSEQLKLLPEGKKISQQGFNYLHSDNVLNILRLAYQANPTDEKFVTLIKSLVANTDFLKEFNTMIESYELIEIDSADSVSEIQALEKRMKKAIPEVKERVSQYIERGTIAQKVKKLTNFKCLICEALGKSVHGFKKPNGDYYVEAHHVMPVSKLKQGSLSITNLITVCANHHRQLHYGNSLISVNDADRFVFEIDGKKIEVAKIKLKD
jgi:5-methylcytosine-specific restriction protein A